VTAAPPGRDRWLLALCASRTFGTFVFMTYAAALPVLLDAWQMSATRAGSISTGFQAGYAVSLMVFSWLADRMGARRVFLWSAVLSAVASVAFAVAARSYLSGLVLYTLVAVSQGGTYTTAIMLVADRYPPARRGAAVGWLIASSSLGYALSLALSGIALRLGGYPLAFAATSAGPVVALGLSWLALADTPTLVHAGRSGRRFGAEILKNARAIRLMGGYTFHSWELLGMWAWTPTFLAASLAVSGLGSGRAVEVGSYLSAAFHLMGLVSSSSMGALSDRLGRRAVLVGLAAISTVCSFVFGWLIGTPAALVFIVGAVYGFSALGDSPVLSTAFTEAVNPAYLGSGLALRSLLGFGAGAIAPLAFGAVLDLSNPDGVRATWGWAFMTLGIGGAAATACAWSLATDRPREAEGMAWKS
jgi:MFS family permease